MVTLRPIVTAGLILLAGEAALASEPAAELQMGAGAPNGTVRILGRPQRGAIDSAILRLETNPGEVDTPTAGDLTPGPGWTVTNFTRLSAGSVRIDMFNNAGQTQDGTLLTIGLHSLIPGFGAATIRLSGASSLDGLDSDDFPGPFAVTDQSVAFVNGALRRLHTSASGSVAAGRDGETRIAAVEANNTLFLLNATDPQLTPLPGWEQGQPSYAPVSGRPAFGTINGSLAVALGNDDARALIYRVSDGATLFDDALNGPIPVAPAINGTTNDVYWVVNAAEGPQIVHQRIGGARDTVAVGQAGDAVTSSPAITQGMLLIGTPGGALAFRVDPTGGALTPQSGGGVTGEGFTTSPVVVDGGAALIGSASGKVYRVNMATGAPVGNPVALPDGAAPLSDPFYSAARGVAAFGGADGNVHLIDSAMQATALPAGSAPLMAPVLAGTDTFVADGNGVVYRSGPASQEMPLFTAPAKAMAVTGAVSGTDRVLINTQDGYLVSVALP